MSVKFIILGAPRTGSTLLVRTLNSLEGVCCHGELLQLAVVRGYEDGFNPEKASKSERDARASWLLQERNNDPVGFIQRSLCSDQAATGFKALHRAFLDPHWGEVIDSLLADPDIRFIHLRRHNSLKRHVSERILAEGGAIHSAPGGRADIEVRVNIDIPTLLERSSQVAEEGREIDESLSGRRLHQLSYEQLASDTPAAVAGVCEFLGLDVTPSDIVPALDKVGAADLRDTVTNYDELLANEATRAMALSD
jgi:LPS sulfotransferase NodH